MLPIRREQLAWAAGLFDGEGWSSSDRYNRKTGGVTAGCVLGVGQADPRVLYRFQQALGFGSVTGPRTCRRTQMWAFKVHGFQNVQAAAALIWTWLGPVKRAQIAKVLKAAIEMRSKQAKRLFDRTAVVEIKRRLATGEKQRAIALSFGVHHGRISQIARGVTYGWVEA